MADDGKTRKKRGASPRGVFEVSKIAAQVIIDEGKEAQRRKTERLREARLSKASDAERSPSA